MTEELKNKLVRQCKRILKKNKPKRELYKQIESEIILAFNEITRFVAKDLLNKKNTDLFKYARRKVTKAFVALEVKYKVPILPGLEIVSTNLLKDDETYSNYTETASHVESDSGKEEETEMVQSKLDLAKFINAEVSYFSDDYSAVDALLSQINVVEEITEDENVVFALKNIRSRIKNAGLTKKLEKVDTFKNFRATVLAEVKRPSTALLREKLRNMKQGSMDNIEYAKQLHMISKNLTEAYMSEGADLQRAEEYTRDELIGSIQALHP